VANVAGNRGRLDCGDLPAHLVGEVGTVAPTDVEPFVSAATGDYPV